jgi:hypothetical protein
MQVYLNPSFTLALINRFIDLNEPDKNDFME